MIAAMPGITDLEFLIGTLPGYDPLRTAGECWFDAAAAEDAISFIHDCVKQPKGSKAGTPFILQPWQQGLVANLFGWKRPDGTRRFREVFVYVPKKNGKTALIAAVMLYVLLKDDEFGAELYSAASSRDQSALLFSYCVGMIRQCKPMEQRLSIHGDSGAGGVQRVITYRDRMSVYKCLSADANTADGANVSFAAIDELHRHKDGELADVLQKSTAARSQPIVIYTTTADFARESVCNQKLAYARSVRDNPGDPAVPGYDPAFLPVVYEAMPTDDWTDPEVWRKANPNLGVTFAEEFLARECQKAEETPSERNNFRRLHLNIVTEAEHQWLGVAEWDSCGRGYGPERLEGLACCGGLDLSSTTDLTALMMIGVDPDGVVWLWPRFWCPEDTIVRRSKQDRVPYDVWRDDGHLYATPGTAVDQNFIRAEVNRVCKRYSVKMIAADAWNAMKLLIELESDDGVPLVRMGQGIKDLNSPSKTLERLIASKRLRHPKNPVLDWMAKNAVVKPDANENIKPLKGKSTGRIDGISALVMALGVSDLPDEQAVRTTCGVFVV